MMLKTVFPEVYGQIPSLVMSRGRNHSEGRDQLMPRAPRPTYDQTYIPRTLALPYYAA
ncbi:hypothetical protein CK203_023164 [Vitis vinifera]|uniref:Uncharacterized protein n=1 Tax=Vitis vinifera TaxID=29760 RepID=A0A438J1P2_VITVI|nr:hypothetical protein CK203_023164 [Vitis vinifera]